MPSRTPRNGLVTANQKERFQAEFWAVRLVFIPIFVWLRGEIGARSKGNFQRPESNCGVAINSICEVFMARSANVPNACPTSVAGINPGSAHHGDCGHECENCADERIECRKPVTCLHANYLKHSEIGISERIEIFPARDLAKTGSRARSCHA